MTNVAKTWWDETLARKNKDDAALNEARGRRDKLLRLVGSCPIGVAYSACSHLEQQRSTVSISAQRDINALKKSVDDLEDREAAEKANYEREAVALEALTKPQQQKTERKKVLNKTIGDRERQLGEGDSVRKTLAEWEENRKAPETEKLRKARSNVSELEKELDSAKGAKVTAQQQVSDRERAVNARFAKLAEKCGALGRYVPADGGVPHASRWRRCLHGLLRFSLATSRAQPTASPVVAPTPGS